MAAKPTKHRVKMVVKTEYGRAFKPKLECYAKLYEDNFDYRAMRRSAEFLHSADAFVWEEDEEWETDSDNSVGHTPRPRPVSSHKYKHDKCNQIYKDKLEKSCEIHFPQQKCEQDIQVIPNQVIVNKNTAHTCQVLERGTNHLSSGSAESLEEDVQLVRDRKVQTPDWRRLQKKEERKQNEQAAKDGRRVHDVAVQVRKPSSRPRKPVQRVTSHRKPTPKARPMSAPIGRPVKKPEVVKPPFLPYGCRDDERETGVLKTYNVRASNDIYPSALRALRRRQYDIERRQKEAESAPMREKRKQADFNNFDERMDRETANWATEYRRHYVGYDQAEYEKRAMSARFAPRKDHKLVFYNI